MKDFDPDDYYDDLEEELEPFDEEPTLEELLEILDGELGDLKEVQTDSEDLDDVYHEHLLDNRKVCDQLANLLDDE